jgi:hypothetical protein
MDLVKRIYVTDLNTKIEIETNTITNTETKDISDTKKIIFTGTTTKYEMNKIDNNNQKKDRKKKVETNTWNLNEEELSFKIQLELLQNMYKKTRKTEIVDTNANNFIINHIKTKISSYKQQDILKNIFLEPEFVTFEYVVNLLNACDLKCHYCSCETYLLYEFVRDMKQWSLDRIDNDIGHNKNNLVMACLECNLKRRRTNKDAFFMTKNLTITRL